MSVDKVRTSKIRYLIKQLRAVGLYHLMIDGRSGDCLRSIRLYENDARELCDEVGGLLREVEREGVNTMISDELEREREDRKTEKIWIEADRELERAVKNRVAAGNELAVVALRRLVKWVPECGFPKSINPAHFDWKERDNRELLEDYREERGLNDPELPFCTETYTNELWGKEDARSFLAYLGQIARALGLEGLDDRRL